MLTRDARRAPRRRANEAGTCVARIPPPRENAADAPEDAEARGEGPDARAFATPRTRDTARDSRAA